MVCKNNLRQEPRWPPLFYEAGRLIHHALGHDPIGQGSHDINHLLPLVQSALKTFRLKHVLGDKAYLAEDRVGILKSWGITAYIPVRKRMEPREGSPYFEALFELVERFDKRQAEFQGAYRFRVKIESFFALLKKVADGYCWSRGRPPVGASGPSSNAVQPCVAWINEALCKIIYANLRTTVHYELQTGYDIDYVADTFFRAIPKDQRLVA